MVWFVYVCVRTYCTSNWETNKSNWVVLMHSRWRCWLYTTWVNSIHWLARTNIQSIHCTWSRFSPFRAIIRENNSQFIYLLFFCGCYCCCCFVSALFICSLGLIKSHAEKKRELGSVSQFTHKNASINAEWAACVCGRYRCCSMHWIQLCCLCALVVVAIYSLFFHSVSTQTHIGCLCRSLAPPLCH